MTTIGEWLAQKAHRDAYARWVLLDSWLKGEAGWRSAAWFLSTPGAVNVKGKAYGSRLPLVAPPCPIFSALRRPKAKAVRPERTARRALLRRVEASAAQRGRADFCCPARKAVDDLSVVIGAMVAFRLLAPKLVIVGKGIDTLELHTKVSVGSWTGGKLEALFQLAQATQSEQAFEAAGVELLVQPRMIKGGWLLKNPASDVVVRVKPEAGNDEPAITVELHAAVLWARGWRESGELARRICVELCGTEEVDLQVTRVDLCADFQGWQPTPEDREQFVSRAKKRGRYSESHVEPHWDQPDWIEATAKRAVLIGRQIQKASSIEERQRLLEVLLHAPEERATSTEYEIGRLSFTGFAFGLGHHLSARLYNKSRECRVSRKGWFSEIWRRSAGYRAPNGHGTVNGKMRAHYDVWRLEFQLRREALREFTVNVEGGWIDLSSWDDCAENLDNVWRYLSLHWLRHGYRSAENRLVLSEPWKVLHHAKLEDSGQVEAGLERHIAEVGVKPTLGAVGGYVSTAIAQLEELDPDLRATKDFDFHSLQNVVLLAAHQHAKQAGASLSEKVDEKRKKIRERKEFLGNRIRSKVKVKELSEVVQQRYGRVDGVLFKRGELEDQQEELTKRWQEISGTSEPLRATRG